MKNRLMNNFGLKFIALLFSILLWLIVMNISRPIVVKTFYPEITVANPEVVTGHGQTFKIENGVKQVAVTVRAERSVMEKIKTENIKAIADLKEEQSGSVPVRVTIEGFEGDYKEALPNPRNIQIVKENIENKTFPITAIATGELQHGYVIGELEAEPKSIDISGPKSSLGRISKVVARVNVSGLSEDATLKADELIYYDSADNVIDKNLLSSNVDNSGVNIKVHLLETKEVELKFDQSEIGTEQGYAVSGLEVEPQRITIMGNREEIEQIEYLEMGSGVMNRRNLPETTRVVVNVTDYLPEGISLIDDSMESVVVNILVEREGIKIFTIPVRSIAVNNLPEGLELSYGPDQNVELKFEGLDETLETMSAEKIAASIDLKNYTEEGTYDVPVTIASLPNGCSFVGGATIQIILTKK